jgi:hypothetical protein
MVYGFHSYMYEWKPVNLVPWQCTNDMCPILHIPLAMSFSTWPINIETWPMAHVPWLLKHHLRTINCDPWIRNHGPMTHGLMLYDCWQRTHDRQDPGPRTLTERSNGYLQSTGYYVDFSLTWHPTRWVSTVLSNFNKWKLTFA